MSDLSNDIIFVKTRYEYDSYTDFFNLVELSGFPVIYVDQLRVSDYGVYIVTPMNGEWRPHIDNQNDEPRNAHLILWNIERPSGSTGSVGNYTTSNRDLIDNRYVDEVWVSDRRLADETKHSTRFVTLGSHPKLGVIDETPKEYSFCHLSYANPRRQTIYNSFAKDEVGPNGWGEARHEMLKRCKFALNVHQDNHPFQEPLRWALFAAYGIPILSETVFDAYPWSDEFMTFAGYDSLVGKMRLLLSEPYEKYKEMGLRARERMCNEFGFRKMVEEAVSQSVGSVWR